MDLCNQDLKKKRAALFFKFELCVCVCMCLREIKKIITSERARVGNKRERDNELESKRALTVRGVQCA